LSPRVARRVPICLDQDLGKSEDTERAVLWRRDVCPWHLPQLQRRQPFMKRFLAMLAIAAAFAVQSVVSTPALAADSRLTADGRIPVVFHVTNKDPLMWNQALNNAANYQAIMGKDKVFIEIVVNGPGIRMLLAESEVEPRVTAALTDGVKIVACEQTMKGLKLEKKDMISGIGYVPGGIVEVVDRQREGWAYINY
jgi:hypothetical protein